MTELHDVDRIVDGNVDASHHTLIIAKEEYGKTSYAIDRDQEPALLVAVNDIVFGDTIHEYVDRLGMQKLKIVLDQRVCH